MSVLHDIIGLMTKDEARHLKLFLHRTNAGPERKDIILFDYIRKSQQRYDEEKILQQLYGNGDKNAFYRLKNRLLEDIGKSIALQYFDTTTTNQATQHLALSRLYQDKAQFKIAVYFLKKAEKRALAIQSYELLDVIYSDFIKISHETLSINPETYIEKRKESRASLNRIREIDDILAVLIYRIRLSQGFASKDYKIIELLQKTIQDFSHSEEVKQSPQLRFKIYHSLSRILLQQHDYQSLEEYLLLTLKEFSGENLFNKNNHDTKLQMLTYLANSLYKNGKLKESLAFTEKLKAAMEEHDGLLHDKYLFYYYNALVINYSKLNPAKGIVILEEMAQRPAIRKVPLNRVFIFLNLALLNFSTGQHRTANKNLVKLKLEDGFATLDKAFQFKIAMAELIIRFELGDFDFIERQQILIAKQFGYLLEQSDYSRQKALLGIIQKMLYAHNLRADKRLMKSIDKLIKELPEAEAADNDILSYRDWLTAKIG